MMMMMFTMMATTMHDDDDDENTVPRFNESGCSLSRHPIELSAEERTQFIDLEIIQTQNSDNCCGKGFLNRSVKHLKRGLSANL